MAGVTTNTRTPIDALLTTTADKYYKSGKMHDAIFESNPTFAMLKQKGKIEYADGGYQIDVNLMYGQNTTVGSYTRYEVLDVAPQDGITQALYPWAQYSGSISIDGLSEFQNSGTGRIVKLVGAKIDQTTMTFTDILNADLLDAQNCDLTALTSGNSDKNIISLPMVCNADADVSGTLGGINGNTYSWWRNQALGESDETTTWLEIQMKMARIYNLCTQGTGGSPDAMIMDMKTFENYETMLHQKQRYVKSDRAMGGFETLFYKGCRVFWDVHVPDANYNTLAGANYDDTTNWADGTCYVLNTKFLKLVMGKGKDFRPTPFVKPEDQDARVSNYIFYGQLVCSNRRKQGVWLYINPEIIS